MGASSSTEGEQVPSPSTSRSTRVPPAADGGFKRSRKVPQYPKSEDTVRKDDIYSPPGGYYSAKANLKMHLNQFAVSLEIIYKDDLKSQLTTPVDLINIKKNEITDILITYKETIDNLFETILNDVDMINDVHQPTMFGTVGQDLNIGANNELNTNNNIEKNKGENVITGKKMSPSSSKNSTTFEEDEEKKNFFNNKIVKIYDSFSCLLCDITDIDSLEAVKDHIDGSFHSNFMESHKNLCGDITKFQQDACVKNYICINYGSYPTVARCLACKSSKFSEISQVLEHIDLSIHKKNILKVTGAKLYVRAPLAPCEPLSTKRLEWGPVILTTNRIEFYCYLCKLKLNEFMAFEHVKSKHPNGCVDGIQQKNDSEYFCVVCDYSISGRKDLKLHTNSVEHRRKADSRNYKCKSMSSNRLIWVATKVDSDTSHQDVLDQIYIVAIAKTNLNMESLYDQAHFKREVKLQFNKSYYVFTVTSVIYNALMTNKADQPFDWRDWKKNNLNK